MSNTGMKGRGWLRALPLQAWEPTTNAAFAALKKPNSGHSKSLIGQDQLSYLYSSQMPVLEDQYGRTFRTLRVSLLQHCNLGCVYCVAGEEEVKRANTGKASLPVEELLAMIGR